MSCQQGAFLNAQGVAQSSESQLSQRYNPDFCSDLVQVLTPAPADYESEDLPDFGGQRENFGEYLRLWKVHEVNLGNSAELLYNRYYQTRRANDLSFEFGRLPFS